jgi:hypothetical protein
VSRDAKPALASYPSKAKSNERLWLGNPRLPSPAPMFPALLARRHLIVNLQLGFCHGVKSAPGRQIRGCWQLCSYVGGDDPQRSTMCQNINIVEMINR